MFGGYSLQNLHEDVVKSKNEIRIDVACVNQAIMQTQRDVKDLNMLVKTLSDTHIQLNELVKMSVDNLVNINDSTKDLNNLILKIEKLLENKED